MYNHIYFSVVLFALFVSPSLTAKRKVTIVSPTPKQFLSDARTTVVANVSSLIDLDPTKLSISLLVNKEEVISHKHFASFLSDDKLSLSVAVNLPAGMFTLSLVLFSDNKKVSKSSVTVFSVPERKILVAPQDSSPTETTTSVTKDDALSALPHALTAYWDMYAKAIAGGSHGDLADKAVLVFRCSAPCGLGNHELSLVSALYMAIAMDRLLFVDCAVVLHLFAPPANVNWNYSWLWETHLKNKFNPDDTVPLLDLTHRSESTFAEVLCTDFTKRYNQRVVVTVADQYHVPLVRHNALLDPAKQAVVASILEPVGDGAGPMGKVLFAPLARSVLLRPRLSVLDRVEHFYNTHLKGHAWVSLQVRTATMAVHDNPAHAFPPEAIASFLTAYAACVHTAAAHVRPSPAGFRVFLSTDRVEVRDQLAAILGDRLVTLTHAVERDSLEGIEAALVDQVLLSRGDAIVLTQHSTFGAVAAGMSATVPFFVNAEGVCSREITSDPAFDRWWSVFPAPCYDRLTMTSPDVRWIADAWRPNTHMPRVF